jgi:PPOX class probable F420-dependent enzyme
MATPALPQELVDFLGVPRHAVIATLKPDGAPHTAETWYLFEDGRVLVNMDASRRRLRNLRADPRVSITVISGDDSARHVTLTGRAAAIEDDTDFDGIDRLSRHYTGQPFPRRDRPRVNAWIDVDSWHAWAGDAAWR